MSQKKSVKVRHEFKVYPKTKGQEIFLNSIRNNTITLCSGFAGTGKSCVALGAALEFIRAPNTPYDKIYIVRPAIEACGEKIGYLPGGANDKMRPFIQPIVDNLRVFFRDEAYINSLLDGGINGAPQIEIIPMAFMRGRNFNNCVVIFDEAQNATPAQMKMFLTRMGQDCKMIIEGDITQSDIFKDRTANGLFDAIERLRDVPNVGVCALEYKDIQRNPLLIPILERYEDVDGF